MTVQWKTSNTKACLDQLWASGKIDASSTPNHVLSLDAVKKAMENEFTPAQFRTKWYPYKREIEKEGPVTSVLGPNDIDEDPAVDALLAYNPFAKKQGTGGTPPNKKAKTIPSTIVTTGMSTTATITPSAAAGGYLAAADQGFESLLCPSLPHFMFQITDQDFSKKLCLYIHLPSGAKASDISYSLDGDVVKITTVLPKIFHSGFAMNRHALGKEEMVNKKLANGNIRVCEYKKTISQIQPIRGNSISCECEIQLPVSSATSNFLGSELISSQDGGMALVLDILVQDSNYLSKKKKFTHFDDIDLDSDIEEIFD